MSNELDDAGEGVPAVGNVRPPTIYDVARVAGVSHQTVSRYLRGMPNVRPAMRDRIADALVALDYRPNSAARWLRGQRVNRIAVLVHALGEAGPSRTLAGAAAAAREFGFVLDVVDMDGDDASSIEAAVAVAGENLVAGLIATAQTESVLEVLRSGVVSVPTVTEASRMLDGSAITHDEQIAILAADHVVELGLSPVAYLPGPLSWAAAARRRRAFVGHARTVGVQVLELPPGDWSAGSGYRAALEHFRDGPITRAIVAGNDGMAIGVLAALRELRVRIPEQVAVIGVDDVPEAAFQAPALTTVALDFFGEGRALVEQLLLVTGAVGPQNVAIADPPRLIVRDSTVRVR